MKFCKDCVHYHDYKAGFRPWCSGPHIAIDIVSGERNMSLPEARYSGGHGLERGVQPCGESQANHYKEK